MFRFAGVSASALPFVTNGTADATPPLPVLVPIPAPVRRNHVSNVKCAEPNAAADPIVTYWLEPLNSSACGPAGACGVALASGDGADAFHELSTATTA